MNYCYAMVNVYGSETDRGFANTWGLVAFHSRERRGEYFDERNDPLNMETITFRKARERFGMQIIKDARQFAELIILPPL